MNLATKQNNVKGQASASIFVLMRMLAKQNQSKTDETINLLSIVILNIKPLAGKKILEICIE